jgi:hypothetical protein
LESQYFLFVPDAVDKIFTAAFLTLAALGLQFPNIIVGQIAPAGQVYRNAFHIMPVFTYEGHSQLPQLDYLFVTTLPLIILYQNPPPLKVQKLIILYERQFGRQPWQWCEFIRTNVTNPNCHKKLTVGAVLGGANC